MTDEACARRCYSVNETLIKIMAAQIKRECRKMIDAGADINQVNQVLPSIIHHWDIWREAMLQECMADFDDLDRQASVDGPSPLTPLRPN